MCSNKVEYSTAAGLYCMDHDFRVRFFMPEYSSIKIISHRFHVDNNEDDLSIGYDMIIVRGLMVHIGLLANFKRQVIQWDGAIFLMKQPSGMLGQTDLTSCEMREMIIQTT